MGSFCSSPSKVTQEQTYNPDPFAKGMIQNALMTAGNVAQTPFHTPQAPVAGFSGQQNQAFNLANNVPGAAQPYFDQASRYMSGQGVGDFYNPYAANVMANLKDVFGQQMSDTTGKLTQAAGGVGADRIAVGQAELAREQGLAAGQTAANLWQPALSASQNAGYGMGNLGQLNQATQMQGVNQLLTTGGLQQQLQQAQMNAPYQQQLAQIQWPYQNAQFLAGITGALAPGMGSQQTGSTTYPQANPFGTIAGLGMAGAGAYGLYNQQQPQQTAARGGRMYADGGDVNNPFGLIDISRQGLVPNVQLQPIHAPNPMAQTQAPPSSPSALGIGKDMLQMYGAGRGAASLFGPGKAAAEVPHEAAPLGGASYDDFLAAENAPEAAAESGGLWNGIADAGSGAWDALSGAGAGLAEGVGGAASGIGDAIMSALPFLFLSTGGRAGNPYASGGRVGYADGGLTPPQQQMPMTGAMGGTLGMSGAPTFPAPGPQMNGMFGGAPGGGQPMPMTGAMGGNLGMNGVPAFPQNGQPQMNLNDARGMLGMFGGAQSLPALFAARGQGGFGGWGQGSQNWQRGWGRHANGGRVGYADGGGVEWPPMRWDIPLMALGPRGIKVTPQTNPPLRYNGRFANEATMQRHPARQAFPEIAVANSMMHADPFGDRARFARPAIAEDFAPQISRGIPEDSQPMIEHPDWMDHRTPPAPDLTEMGRMAPAAAPVPEQMGMGKAALPLPRSRRKVIIEEEVPRRNILRGHASGFQEGGDVPEEGIEPPLFLRSGMEEMPPTPSPMRSSREAKPLGAPRGTALREDLENLRYLRDNPGVALSGIPSVAGNIIGAAVENQTPRDKPLGAPRTQPQKTWLPGVSDIFDMSAHAADAPPDPEPVKPVRTPLPEEVNSLQKLETQIAEQREKVAQTERQYPPVTDKTTKQTRDDSRVTAEKNKLSRYEEDVKRINATIDARHAPDFENYKELLKDWNARETERKSKLANVRQPYALKYPGRQELVQKWGPPAALATGALAGAAGSIKGAPVKALLGAIAAGGLEGAGSSLWATKEDAEYLPAGSPERLAALDRLWSGDPETWKAAGTGAAGHAVLSAGAAFGVPKIGTVADAAARRVGAGVNATARGLRNVADWWRKAPSADVAAAVPAPTRIRMNFEMPDGSTVTRRLVNGKETWHGINEKTGKHGFISKPDISKAKAGEPEHYAGGGTVPFEDRWDPVTWGIQSGLLDPQGENYPSQIAPFASVPMPRPNPFRGEDVGVEAGGDEIPSGNPLGLPPRGGGTNPYALPQGRTQDASQQRNLMDSPWMGLLAAGLGTMASAGQRDARGLPMSPMAAIGHGGAEGIKTLQHQREAAMKQQSIDQRARQLHEQAQTRLAQMAETTRHNKTTEERQKEALEFQKSRLGTGLFDAETTRTMAEQALTGDKSVFANLGRGVAGPQNIVQVRQEMNRIAKERGLSGSDIAALNANFSAQTAAARTAATREANIATAVEEAKGTFPLALAASDNLPRSEYTPINRLLAAYRTGTSTPEQAEFALAHQAVITAYSQAMSRTGVNTVHAQERAEKAFSDVQNHESYERAIKQLEREMAIALSAPEKARQMIMNRISGKKEETSERPKGIPEGAKQAPDKKWYIPDPDRPGKYLEVRP